MAMGGVIAALSTPFLFPVLSKRIKLKLLYRRVLAVFPVGFIAMPLINVVARRMTSETDDEALTPRGRTVVWLLIGLLLLTIRMCGMAFAYVSRVESEYRTDIYHSAHTIFVKHSAPSRLALGSTFGIAQTVGCSARAFSPAFVR